MKVLFVHDSFGELGGAESTIRLLGSGMKDRGLDLGIVYGTATGKGQERYADLFSPRWCWNERGIDDAIGWNPDAIFVHKLGDLSVLKRIVASGRPLVRMVHDHDIYCQRRHRYLPWNRQVCTRRAGWECGVLCGVVRNERGFPLRVAWPGTKLDEISLCRRFDHHITVSDFLKDELLLHDFDADRITTLWPPVAEARAEKRATYLEPLVVFAGQILRGKGVDVLIEALAHLKTPGWRCQIVGDGSHATHCKKLAFERDLSDRIHWSGWLPQNEFHQLLETARAGVVPSVWPEPLGAVGIEMLRHGLPVVGHDVGGIREWLKDGVNGYLVPPFEPTALADRLDRLLSDPKRARQMGERGQVHAARWCNTERYFETVIDILRQASQNGRPHAEVDSSAFQEA